MKGTLRWLKAPFIFLGTIVEPVFEHVRLRFREPIFRRFETSPVLFFMFCLKQMSCEPEPLLGKTRTQS